MKVKHFLSTLTAFAIVAGMGSSLTSCSDDDDSNWYILQVGSYNVNYNADNYWADCYNVNPVATLTLGPVSFSHNALVSEWDGIEYKSWSGFCPSRSTDNADYPAGERYEHQWASITGTDAEERTSGYMLAFWDVNEPLNTIPENPSLKISLVGGNAFTPSSVSITNNAYSYYTMLKGSDFSEAFDVTSWTTVSFIGVKDGKTTGKVTAYLANGGKILDKWTDVALDQLGLVDYIYCQMESSDTGAWGMNVPAYFCLDNLALKYENN